jgi:hypothetical protein
MAKFKKCQNLWFALCWIPGSSWGMTVEYGAGVGHRLATRKNHFPPHEGEGDIPFVPLGDRALVLVQD